MQKPPPLFLGDIPGGPPPGTLLTIVADLPEHGGKDILFQTDTFRVNIFIQKSAAEVLVFENSCPHAGTPLNLFGDKFLNLEKTHILCRTHGALFSIKSGKCVAGPCKGQYLRTVACEFKNGGIYSL